MADETTQVEIDAAVEALWTQVGSIVNDLPGIYDTWLLQKTGLGIEEAWECSKALRKRVGLIVDKIGETFKAWPDKSMRRMVILALCKRAWKLYGKDIPWVDDDNVIEHLVDGALAAWRARRRMAKS